MSQPTTCRVVEVNISAVDTEEAARFYEAAFEVEIVRDEHEDGHVHLMAVFGTWPSDEFFLLNISDGDRRPDRMGRADFGFLVDDLDAAHARAMAAGAREIASPHDAGGMPRLSTVLDPAGNMVHLYQNVPSSV